MAITVGDVKNNAISQLNQHLSDVIDLELFCRTYNRVRQDYREEAPWDWNRADVVLTGTIVPSGTFAGLYSFTLPSDWNIYHQPDIEVMVPFVSLDPIAIDEVSLARLLNMREYQYGYLIQGNALYSNVQTLYIGYWGILTDLPLDSTQDNNVEPFTSIEAVTMLLIGRYWYQVERKTGKHQEYLDLYKTAVDKDKKSLIDAVGYSPASYRDVSRYSPAVRITR